MPEEQPKVCKINTPTSTQLKQKRNYKKGVAETTPFSLRVRPNNETNQHQRTIVYKHLSL